MDNQNQARIKNKWNIFRWILFLPTALLVAVAGNLFLGLIFIIVFKNQAFLDGVSAFVFCFLFVFSAGFFAPSKRTRVTGILFGIIVFLAILSFILATLGVEVFVETVMPSRLSISILQILGALYAMFLIPPLTTRGTTLEQFWKEIVALGTIIMIFGGILSTIGLVTGIIVRTWATFFIGVIVLSMGLVTEFLPYIHLFLRVRKGKKMTQDLIQELKEQSRVEKQSKENKQ